MTDISPFVVKSCALASIATGEQSISLIGLRDTLARVPLDCIYYHFWGGRFFSQFVHPDYHNDFAVWTHERLHDEILAERLGILDPTEYDSLEDLRTEILEVIEQRLDEYSMVPLAKKGDLFHFIRSTIIVFDTPYVFTHPTDMPKKLPALSPSSFFYHCIDSRSRTEEKKDDFSAWLTRYGEEYRPLVEELSAIDPYFLALSSLRDEVIRTVRQFFERKEGIGYVRNT